MELPLGDDYAKARCCARSRVYGGDQAPARDAILVVGSDRGMYRV